MQELPDSHWDSFLQSNARTYVSNRHVNYSSIYISAFLHAHVEQPASRQQHISYCVHPDMVLVITPKAI
ncbi:hypothetical protein XENTR_v10019511 [Xenopus tropicalis]|nr:hypothetical protein XENTR_v10019511 [Xenopus tropicalis]